MKLAYYFICGYVLINPVVSAETTKQSAFNYSRCNSNDDLIKLVEFIAKTSVEKTEEMMFLMPVYGELTGNALDDSIGYFIHNKNKPQSSFTVVLWFEKQKSCLIFDGVLVRRDDPERFFNERNKILEIMRKLITN